MKPRIAILASGEGTTAEAFIRACSRDEVDAEVGLVICNREAAGIFQRIENLNLELGLTVQTMLLNSQTHPAADGEVVERGYQTTAEEAAILDVLTKRNFDLILLMGYLRRVGSSIVQAFGWRPEYSSPYRAIMLNSHPGLLPETTGTYGIHTQEATLDQKLAYSGQTLHVVSENYDEGPVLAVHKVAVLPNDTAESLFGRVQTVEKQNLPIDVAAFMKARRQYILESK
jgi:phosphoribosylglycinamide formyltransferase-1